MGDYKPIKVTPIVIEGFEVNGQNVTFQKLQEFSLTLFQKLLNHRNQRNLLLLERDKLRTILENTRHEIKLTNDIGLNKDEEFERAEDRQRQDLKQVDQEVKYILYDHDINLKELKAWDERMTIKSKDKHFVEELELLQEKRQLKEELERERYRHNDEVSELKAQHLNEITILKQEIDSLQIEKKAEFKVKFNKTVETLILKHEMEISELEERKNTHIAELKKIHAERINETKDFFNTVTAENLTVISNLKQSLDNMKRNKTELSSEVKLLRQANDKIREPLDKSKAEVKTLTRKRINYEKDLLSLKNNRRMLESSLQQAKQVRTENTLLMNKLRNIEHNESNPILDSTHLYSLSEFENYFCEKRSRLEELISFLLEELKGKQKTIQEFLSLPDINQAFSKLHFEYWTPKQLTFELAVVSKAHDELLRTLEEKLKEFCVPEHDLGFKVINMPYVTTNPAALVSKQ